MSSASLPTNSPEPLRVLLEDGPLLAVAKPAGLPTQAPGDALSLEHRVKNYLRDKYQKAGNVYLGIPHRLDRPVSGIVVFARNSKAAARLAEQFRDRVVRKTYHAILSGIPTPPAGGWSDLVRKIPDEPRGEVVSSPSPDARLAELRYKVVAHWHLPCANEYSSTTAQPANTARALVEIELLTGRMHQIRLQSSSRGCPVVGDALYGGPPLPIGTHMQAGPPSTHETTDPSARILLHARSLTLLHPIRYEPVVIECPWPDWWPPLPEGIVPEYSPLTLPTRPPRTP